MTTNTSLVNSTCAVEDFIEFKSLAKRMNCSSCTEWDTEQFDHPISEFWKLILHNWHLDINHGRTILSDLCDEPKIWPHIQRVYLAIRRFNETSQCLLSVFYQTSRRTQEHGLGLTGPFWVYCHLSNHEQVGTRKLYDDTRLWHSVHTNTFKWHPEAFEAVYGWSWATMSPWVCNWCLGLGLNTSTLYYWHNLEIVILQFWREESVRGSQLTSRFWISYKTISSSVPGRFCKTTYSSSPQKCFPLPLTAQSTTNFSISINLFISSA